MQLSWTFLNFKIPDQKATIYRSISDIENHSIKMPIVR